MFQTLLPDKLTLSSSEEINALIVYDCLGQQMFRQTVNDLQAQFYLNDLSKGIYFFRIVHKNGVTVIKKIVKN